MLKSLDCTNCEWFGCPQALRGQYVRRGHGSNPFILLESVSNLPEDDYQRLQYKLKHEAQRKDVERAFGVLKKKWVIIADPARQYVKEKTANMMYTFIILHNMIIKDQDEAISPNLFHFLLSYDRAQHAQQYPINPDRVFGTHQMVDEDEWELSIPFSVQGLMMHTAAAEEEITRWKVVTQHKLKQAKVWNKSM
ncbi:ALP1-like protein [Tanacetum coccineum]